MNYKLMGAFADRVKSLWDKHVYVLKVPKNVAFAQNVPLNDEKK